MDAPRRLTVRGLFTLASLSLLLFVVHASDDVARGEGIDAGFLGGNEGAAVIVVLVGVLVLFGIGWTWKERRIGYGMLLILSIFPLFFDTFLSHVGGVASADTLTRIAESSGVFFVFISIAGGVTSLTSALLAAYALARPKP